MNTLPENDSVVLPRTLYRAEQVRELDRITIEEHGIPGATLMRRAGEAAFACLQYHWPRARALGVLCGVGNNGGDGFVVARLALEAGYGVRVWQVGEAAKIRGDALTAREDFLAAGGVIEDFTGGLEGVEVLVDGLLGTGLNGEVEGVWRTAIEAVNTNHAQGAKVLALDIPSGLHADSGHILGAAVEADASVTFIGLKVGLFTGQGPACCGALSFSSLDVPDTVYSQFTPVAMRLSWDASALPKRRATAHKGDFGHVLVIGGDRGMSGALQLAGEAALRTGAGLVSAATHPEHAAMISAVRPELMVHAVESAADLSPLLKRATVLVVGPGLGQAEWGRALFSVVLACKQPLVVDADGLNLLAIEPLQRPNWILTPHPGEAARLLGQTAQQVQADRLAAAQSMQEKYGGMVVLKGAGTVIVDEHGAISVCSDGNPGMASGGMGDVLSGVIASLLAQGCSLGEAARLGVALHACAADIAAGDCQRGLLASDLFPVMRSLLG